MEEDKKKKLILIGKIVIMIILVTICVGLVFAIVNRKSPETAEVVEEKDEVSAFNEQFKKYEGKQIGSSVKALLLEVDVSNLNDEEAKIDRKVVVKLDGKKVKSTSEIKSTANYNVEVPKDGYDKNGFIKEINVEKIK